MSNPDLSGILQDLAAGRIDAAEASRRIDQAKAAASVEPAPEPEPEREAEPAASEKSGAGTGNGEKVTVRSVGKRVRIVGDRNVATASVDGQHVMRRVGGVLEITSEGDVGPSLEGFSLLRPPRSLDDLATLGMGRELVIRVNPRLPVDAEITAGSLTVEGVPTLGRVRVTAGGCSVKGVRRIDDALVQAGSATVEGVFSQGRSRLKVESGSLSLLLKAGSSVTLRGEAQVGRIQWPGNYPGNVDEVVIGNGTARLDVQIVMGYAGVRAEEDES